MALLSWFQKKPADDDYEQILASLALSIQKRQTQLSEIRLRERRATLLVTTWAFAAWVAYVGIWWMGVLGRRRGYSNGLWGIPVVLGPVVILFTRRVVQLWYTRKGNAEEKTLKVLLVQQRNKIEEIKKKTNYYSTKNLLDRYDEPARRPSNGAPAPKRAPPQLTQTQSGAVPDGSIPHTPSRGTSQAQPFSPLPPLPPPRKQWYDKLADAILGDDTASTGPSPASRYALICARCFTHNGLVKEEQWEDAQYVCPKCGHFNASVRSRKAGGASNLEIPTLSLSAVAPLSRGQESPSAPFAPGSQSAPVRAYSPKTSLPLSASTVLIEKHEAESEDQEEQEWGQGKGERAGDAIADTSVQMDVDS